MKTNTRSGFTLTEVIIVILVITVLTSIAAAAGFGMIEGGRQRNRMNISRTIYLAAQNQLTQLRVSGRLDWFVNEHLGLDRSESSATRLLGQSGMDFQAAGWDDAKDQAHYVHFISSPAGLDFACPIWQLLSPVLSNPEVLENAIVIEFNIRTGMVLSVFYSDARAELL